MRVNFRQGIVGHQTGTFLNINGSGHIDLLAANRAFTVNVAHNATNYIHSEDNTVPSAWIGPFLPATDYWLYIDFNQLTFSRIFASTTIEPVAQSAEPGGGDASLVIVIAGDPGIGQFIVAEHYVLEVGRVFNVTGSTANDGVYTITSAVFDGGTGRTTITVDEPIIDSTVDGSLTLDVDSSGTPLLIPGRHWYDTSTDTHYVRGVTTWSKVLRIFVAQLSNTNFISQSIDAPLFTGSQIGNTSSVLSGRVLVDESFKPLTRTDGTFITTEDQFFTNQSRTDGVRLESNVSKAKNVTTTLAAFTVVSYVDEGEIQTAQYSDTGETVLGLLTESLAIGEVGSVVLQGVVTNPMWDWISLTPVGSQLWVDNGILVFVDPSISDPIGNPQSRVPVARVLARDTIIFEQGLGGKGDTGPVGSVGTLPPATTSVIGGVTLVTPSSDAAQAFVISDTDTRLTDSRNPLPHTHAATDISFTPGFGISSNNLQNVAEELAVEKLDIAGGTMTGALTLVSNPVNVLEAATKQYVDNLVSGLIWIDPVDKVNLIADDITIPPLTPELGDAYIVPIGATGDWTAFASGNVTTWDGTTWIDNGPVTGFAVLPRFGIAFESSATPSGAFAGQQNNIAIYDGTGTLIGFEAPVNTNAVYVRNILSEHAFDQFAFNGSTWTLFSSGQNLSPDNTTIKITSNIISTIPFTSEGGTIDAEKWQGLVPTDLDTSYAALIHSHLINSLTDVDTSTNPPIDGQVLTWNNTNSTWEPATSSGGLNDIVDDLTPQLGGNLDTNGSDIVSINGGPINILVGAQALFGPGSDLNLTAGAPAGLETVVGNVVLTPGTGPVPGQIILSGNSNGYGGTFNAAAVLVSSTGFTSTLTVPALAANTNFVLPPDDGTAGFVLTSDGAGVTTWAAGGGGGGLSNVVEDLTPQLGGNLDTNTFDIVSKADGNLVLTAGAGGGIPGFGNGVDVVITAGAAGGLEANGGNVILTPGSGSLNGSILANGNFQVAAPSTTIGTPSTNNILQIVANGGFAAQISVPPLTSNTTFALPTNNGTNGQSLITDGSGVTDWNGPPLFTGAGTPEGVVVANIGSMYTDSAGGAGTTLYIKESGNGLNTGWVAK